MLKVIISCSGSDAVFVREVNGGKNQIKNYSQIALTAQTVNRIGSINVVNFRRSANRENINVYFIYYNASWIQNLF